MKGPGQEIESFGEKSRGVDWQVRVVIVHHSRGEAVEVVKFVVAVVTQCFGEVHQTELVDGVDVSVDCREELGNSSEVPHVGLKQRHAVLETWVDKHSDVTQLAYSQLKKAEGSESDLPDASSARSPSSS